MSQAVTGFLGGGQTFGQTTFPFYVGFVYQREGQGPPETACPCLPECSGGNARGFFSSQDQTARGKWLVTLIRELDGISANLLQFSRSPPPTVAMWLLQLPLSRLRQDEGSRARRDVLSPARSHFIKKTSSGLWPQSSLWLWSHGRNWVTAVPPFQ